MDQEIKELKSQAQTLDVAVRVGKNGITLSVVEEIKNHLKKKKVIKVKFLKSLMDANDKTKVFDELLEKTGAKLVHKVGFVATICKEKNNK